MTDRELQENYAIFKYNSGAGALLCSKCAVIIKTGREFTEQEWQAARGEIELPSQLCSGCEKELNDILNNDENDIK